MEIFFSNFSVVGSGKSFLECLFKRFQVAKNRHKMKACNTQTPVNLLEEERGNQFNCELPTSRSIFPAIFPATVVAPLRESWISKPTLS